MRTLLEDCTLNTQSQSLIRQPASTYDHFYNAQVGSKPSSSQYDHQHQFHERSRTLLEML